MLKLYENTHSQNQNKQLLITDSAVHKMFVKLKYRYNYNCNNIILRCWLFTLNNFVIGNILLMKRFWQFGH